MKLLFLESNTSGTGRLFCLRAQARGLQPLLLTNDPSRYPFAAENGVPVVTMDTMDLDGVRAFAKELNARGELAGLTTSSEYFIAASAQLAAELGCAGPSPAAVKTCRNKARLTELLAAAGIPVPRSRAVRSAAEAEAAARALGLPVVVKPVAGSGSVGVFRADDAETAGRKAAAILAVRTNERGMPMPDEALVQECIVGREYSVEAMGTRPIGVTSKHLGGPAGTFVEVGHDHPARGPTEEIRQVEEIACSALKAVGFTSGPSHTEIKIGPEGPVVLEINPRLAGGFIPEIVRLSRGVDLIDGAISAALGDAPLVVEPGVRASASIRFLLPPGDGVLLAVEGVEEASKEPAVVEVLVYRQPGDKIALRGDFRDRIAHVIAVSDDADAAAASAERAVGRLVVRLGGERDD